MPSNLIYLIKDHLEQAWYEGRDYKIAVTPTCDGGLVDVYYPDDDKHFTYQITAELLDDESEDFS